jgi:hypothetical protein
MRYDRPTTNAMGWLHVQHTSACIVVGSRPVGFALTSSSNLYRHKHCHDFVVIDQRSFNYRVSGLPTPPCCSLMLARKVSAYLQQRVFGAVQGKLTYCIHHASDEFRLLSRTITVSSSRLDKHAGVSRRRISICNWLCTPIWRDRRRTNKHWYSVKRRTKNAQRHDNFLSRYG